MMKDKQNTMDNNSQFTTHNSPLIKRGYKNTEIGVIPEEWEVEQIQELIKSKIIIEHLDGNHGALYPKSSEFKRDGVPYIGANDFKNGLVDFNNCKFLSKERASLFLKGISKDGDVLFAHNATVGPVALLKTKLDYVILSTTATYFRCNKNKLSNLFLLNFFQSQYFVKQYSAVMSQSTRNQVPITVQKKFFITLPPLPEQTAIATVLSDTDSLIQALQKKIAKKQAIKKGAMQELLKPKEGWVVKTLGEIGNTFGGLSGKSKKDFQDGIYSYIPFMNIMSNPIIDTTYFDYVNFSKGESQNKCIEGDLFFNGSSETPEEVGLCSVLLENIPNLYLNSFCFGFRLFNKEEINGLFLSYFFRSPFGRKHMSLLAQGATRYNLSKANFLNLEIKLPEYKEQTRIAQILSDIDKEIASLEKQLAKYKQVKQGLMQVLLTGKIRLV